MVAVPVATLVKSAVHLPADSEQLADTVPTPGFDDAKLTVPVGTFEAVVVSGTDAVQLEVPPMAIVLGLQAILEDVLSFAPVGVGLVPWGDGECSRNGTRNAPNPATISATAPSLRLLGSIILFLPALFLGNAFFPDGYIIQRIDHQETCQSLMMGRRNLSGIVDGYRNPIYCYRIRRNR